MSDGPKVSPERPGGDPWDGPGRNRTEQEATQANDVDPFEPDDPEAVPDARALGSDPGGSTPP